MITVFQSQLNSQQIVDPVGYFSSSLRDNEYKFALYLLSKATHYKDFYYGQDLISNQLGCSVSSVKRYTKVLEEMGFVQVVRRGYMKTNLYVVNEFLRKNKHLFFSKYKNFLDKGLLTISKTALRLRELLLRNNVVINILDQRASFEEREKQMFQLTDEQVLESKKYPRWAYDRALVVTKNKLEGGLSIKNPAAFFMTVLRGEAAKRALPVRSAAPQEHKAPIKNQPYDRPSTGPYSIYQPKEKVTPPSVFECVMKLEQEYHNNPSNTWRATVADMMLKSLTPEQQNDVWRSIHNETCRCRPDLVFVKKEPVDPVYEDDYEDIDNFVLY